MSTVELPYARGDKFFVTGKRTPRSLLIMVRALAKLTWAAFAVVEYAIILAVLLVLGATAIPGLVRIRKR
jgi:hypothetical protein